MEKIFYKFFFFALWFKKIEFSDMLTLFAYNVDPTLIMIIMH